MKLLITGDFCPINRFNDFIDNNDFLANIKSLTSNVDLAITNLECPLTNSEYPINKTGPSLKSSPRYANLLSDLGFNVVTLANNHIMDYGKSGLLDTMKNLDLAGVSFVGAGKSNCNNNTFFYDHFDLKLAIINVCENEWSTDVYDGYSASPLSEIDIFYSVKSAKLKADVVIIVHHGGHETYPLPTIDMKKRFRYFIDCGADAVINHHTHCFSGYEVYNEKPIFYSLGNFLFDNPRKKNSPWNYGLGVTLNVSKSRIDFEIVFFEQFNDEVGFKVLSENLFDSEIKALNKLIDNEASLHDEFTKFVNTKTKLYNSFLEPTSSRIFLFLINRRLLPSFWSSRKRLYLKNLIRCESHREIILKLLEK
jgi:hypothetical protein